MYRIYCDGELCFSGSIQADAFGYWAYAHKHLEGNRLQMIGPGKDGDDTVLHTANLSKRHHKNSA